MAQVLPASVEELNRKMRMTSMFHAGMSTENESTNRSLNNKLKREVSFPNGVENWNIRNLEEYLDDSNEPFPDFDFCSSPNDRTVPGGDQRVRCESISSTSSFSENAQYSSLKPFSSLLHMGSGSTCIAVDHSYFSPSSSLQTGNLDMEETYANIDLLIKDNVSELKAAEPILTPFSPLPSTSTDLYELTSKSFSSEESTESMSFRSSKRPLDTPVDDDVFLTKQTKVELNETVGTSRYMEIRKKNNIASKNCRKTRKEKQKEMEEMVSKLEEERESLKSKVNLLEQLIEAHRNILLKEYAAKAAFQANAMQSTLQASVTTSSLQASVVPS